MKTESLDFKFPEQLVARFPLNRRSDAKLLVFNRKSQESRQSQFRHLTEFLKPGDLLVFNHTRVLKSRFEASSQTGGRMEGLYLEPSKEGVRVWLQGKRKAGDRITLDHGPEVQILERCGKEAVLGVSVSSFLAYLKTSGKLPIPPYIRKMRKKMGDQEDTAADQTTYQSFFARIDKENSLAASTASLHFDEELFFKLEKKEIQRAELCLQIGLGTFQSIECEDTFDFKIHSESVEIPPETWTKIQEVKKNGGRVIGVGTTVCRSLESAKLRLNKGQSISFFNTDLYIQPGFQFQVLDGLITNFHQPRTSLLLLVSAFLEPGVAEQDSNQIWKRLYEDAIQSEFRLFSFGDGMLIL